MAPEKMISMANQIAGFFHTQPGTDQAAKVADHLNDFWAPRMRAQLVAYVEGGGQGLDPLVIEAMGMVRQAA